MFCLGNWSIGHGNVEYNDYVLHSTALVHTDKVRDLGVTFSKNLKFSDHCFIIARKAQFVASKILRCFVSKDPCFLTKLFKVFVRPILEYNSPVWNPYLIKDIDHLERVQRRFTKYSHGCSGLTYKQRLDKLNLESLEYRRLVFDLVLMYRIVYGKIALKFVDYFTFAPSVGTRGHRLKVSLPAFRTVQQQNSFFCRVPKIWNYLPPDVVESRSVNSFKSSLASADLTIYLRGNAVR